MDQRELHKLLPGDSAMLVIIYITLRRTFKIRLLLLLVWLEDAAYNKTNILRNRSIIILQNIYQSINLLNTNSEIFHSYQNGDENSSDGSRPDGYRALACQ